MGNIKLSLILILLLLMGCTNQVSGENTNGRENNSKSEQLVAKVGQQEITSAELEQRMRIKKEAYEKLNKPQSDLFYKTVSLGMLVEHALLKQEAKAKGINVTAEEAAMYLKEQLEQMRKLQDNDPIKVNYFNAIKTNGYNSPEEYINSPEIISIHQDILTRSKLKSLITKNGNWDAYIEGLINNKNNYEIFINIDIRNYRELERVAVIERR
ncbi:MAG: SurA N-terminal domain-containing protein [Peptococcaceae bacterium]|nr:SurA N-terminal domain-containing protein [Peptococcaceae bacterium]MDH7524789.1 SurA N-terminal domain-containing protein [Peptococcaceae bacterium]